MSSCILRQRCQNFTWNEIICYLKTISAVNIFPMKASYLKCRIVSPFLPSHSQRPACHPAGSLKKKRFSATCFSQRFVKVFNFVLSLVLPSLLEVQGDQDLPVKQSFPYSNKLITPILNIHLTNNNKLFMSICLVLKFIDFIIIILIKSITDCRIRTVHHCRSNSL